jgi:hypothetical protein
MVLDFDKFEEGNPFEPGQMLECVGGPLDGKEISVEECDTISDIYYEMDGLFYKKVADEKGTEVCHWYAVLIRPDPVTPHRWWKFYSYRGIHPEDAADGDTRHTFGAFPVIPPGFPQYEQED